LKKWSGVTSIRVAVGVVLLIGYSMRQKLSEIMILWEIKDLTLVFGIRGVTLPHNFSISG
jgi:hypothetical protein